MCGYQDIERELELQIGMKQEVEVAMRLLEKDGHDKQELTASLRKQLEDVKNINIEMHSRLQVSACHFTYKTLTNMRVHSFTFGLYLLTVSVYI